MGNPDNTANDALFFLFQKIIKGLNKLKTCLIEKG